VTVQAVAFCWPLPAPWTAATECLIELERRTWNALLAVAYGRGGRAGGAFLVNTTDQANNPVSQHYCLPGYISGQGGYIQGD
jgi:hypothetical protein